MRMRIAALTGVLLVVALPAALILTDPAAGSARPGNYIYGYLPSRSPALCVHDQTAGLPVAEAITEYERTNVDVFLAPDCPDGALPLPIVAIDTLPCDGPNGCHIPAEDSWKDHDGLTVLMPGGLIWLDGTRDNSEQMWTKIIIHEIGHAIGLAHTERDSVMRRDDDGVIDNGDYELTDLDIATINDLYPGH